MSKILTEVSRFVFLSRTFLCFSHKNKHKNKFKKEIKPHKIKKRHKIKMTQKWHKIGTNGTKVTQ
jgi:hypothetical protein